jgi:tRNA (cytidine/uridine-2'-O-)-methyltransferase
MHVVLVEPRIPQNTGSIARTCAATETPLHIVGPTVFEISERTVRRAGLDYWPHVNLSQHANWEAFINEVRPGKVWLIENFGTTIYHQAVFSPSDAIVFGNENSGLSPELIASVPPEQILRIPMPCTAVRSINLSNAVSVVLYEARRQLQLDR